MRWLSRHYFFCQTGAHCFLGTSALKQDAILNMDQRLSDRMTYTTFTASTQRVRFFAASQTVPEDTFGESLAELKQLAQDQGVTLTELNLFASGLSESPEFAKKLCGIAADVFAQTAGISLQIDRIPQSPGVGLVAWEAYGIGPLAPNDETVRIDARNGVLNVEYAGLQWIHLPTSGSLLPLSDTRRGGRVHTDCLEEFRRLRERLESLELSVSFGEIVRTWLYLGDIVGPERVVDSLPEPQLEPQSESMSEPQSERPCVATTQRYRELNRARSDFFDTVTFATERTVTSGVPFYPASTGIGTDGRGILFAARALHSDRSDVQVVMLENPRQVSAFDYGREYSLSSPKFARALAVLADEVAIVFISGTASITDSESRHDDVARQTHETLDNIAALVGEANFARMGRSGYGVELTELASIRVYVKRVEEIPTVRTICETRLPSVPAIYVVADVCRPELLVEIEGLAVTSLRDNVMGPI